MSTQPADIATLEREVMERIATLNKLRAASEPRKVPSYTFATQTGDVTLRGLFGDHDKLLVIHNMGQGCRYCTLWADGFNGILHHLESAMAVVLVSKDAPDMQRRFANSRGWRFRLASHGGGAYMTEQVPYGNGNMPGAVVYERKGDTVFRKNACAFGPGDIYCAMWSFLGLAGIEEWTPQFSYWTRPPTLDDGGDNVLA